MIRPGFWTDVCVTDNGRFAQVTTEGATVRVFLGTSVTKLDAPEPLLFCRCAESQALILSIHQGQSGTAWLIGAGEPRNLGPTFGVQPVAITRTHAYVVRSNQAYIRISLESGEAESFPHRVPGSSQGISDIEPDGTIRWADTSRSLVEAGLTLTYPNRRGAVVVGQADPPQIAGVFSGHPFTAHLGDGFEPHVAQWGDKYAIVARTSQGALYLEGPPFPAFVSAPAPLPIPPKPTPVPEPVPMPVPNHLATVERLRQKYPTPLGSRHWEFLVELAQTIRGKLFRKDGGTNVFVPQLGFSVSADIVILDGFWIDVLGDAENLATPAWDAHPNAGEPEKWIDVSGVIVPNPGTTVPNPGTPPVPPPAPPAPPQPDPVLGELRQQIAEAKAQILALQTRLDIFRAELAVISARRYRVRGQTGRSLGHGHNVDLVAEIVP